MLPPSSSTHCNCIITYYSETVAHSNAVRWREYPPNCSSAPIPTSNTCSIVYDTGYNNGWRTHILCSCFHKVDHPDSVCLYRGQQTIRHIQCYHPWQYSMGELTDEHIETCKVAISTISLDMHRRQPQPFKLTWSNVYLILDTPHCNCNPSKVTITD